MTDPNRQFPRGKRPADLSRKRVTLLSTLVPALLPHVEAAPPAVDNYSAVAEWGMDANDRLGDCVIANGDHSLKTFQARVKDPLVASTEKECIAIYSAVTGYDPKDPSTDQGTVMQDFYDYWRKSGLKLGKKANRILLFADLDFTDMALVKWAVWTFGAIGLGFAFPDSAMTQFNQGEPWTVDPGNLHPSEGHAVTLAGYDADFAYVVSWGRVQKMTWGFFAQYVDEAWLVLTQDEISQTSGDDPLGHTFYALGQQFSALTGQKNPIPAPVPAPPVDPTPEPAEGTTVVFTAKQLALLDHFGKAPHLWHDNTLAARAWKAARTA